MNNKKDTFFRRLGQAMSFGFETGSVAKLTIVIFLLLLASKVLYYFSFARVILTWHNMSPEALLSAVTNGSLINNSDYHRWVAAEMFSSYMGIFLSGVYVVFYLFLKRRPEEKLPQGSISYYSYVLFSIFLNALIFMVLNNLFSAFVPFFAFAFWPMSVYSFCNRAEFGGSTGVAVVRGFSLMKGNIWRSIGYAALIALLIYLPLCLLVPVFILALPAYAVKIIVVLFLLADSVFVLTYSRFFVGMYVDNVQAPVRPEEE